MEAALVKVKASVGKRVRLQQAELEFLKKLEGCRDFLTTALTHKAKSSNFMDMVGEDGSRVARAAAVIESASLSETNASDPRIVDCKAAIESVEAQLRDMGVEHTSDDTKEEQRGHLLKRQGTLVEDYITAKKQLGDQRRMSVKSDAVSMQQEPSETATVEAAASLNEEEEPDPVKMRVMMAQKRMSLSEWYDDEAAKNDGAKEYATKVRMLLVLEEVDEEEEDDD